MSKRRWLSMALGIGCVLALNSCGSSTDAPADVALVTIDIASTTLLAGTAVTLTATVKGKLGTVSDATVTWRSNNTTVADVSSSGTQARVTAKSPGTATITATAGGQSASSTITVTNVPVASVRIAEAVDTIGVGATKQLTAAAYDSGGGALPNRTIAWNSLNSNIATVDGSGTVTARALGTAQIVATCETKSATAVVTVTPGAVAQITISPSSLSLYTGDTSHFQVVLTDIANDVLSGRTVTWTSSDSTVAGVAPLAANNAIGSIRAKATGGPVTVTATSEGKSTSATVKVALVPVAAVDVSPSSLTLVTGGAGTVTGTPRDSAGGALSDRTIAWSSSDTTIATVQSTGPSTAKVNGVKPGTTVLSATVDTKVGSIPVTVQAGVATLSIQGVASATHGNGLVTSSPAGINCTVTMSATSGTCSAQFTGGSVVALTAVPQTSVTNLAVGSSFAGWTGPCSGTVACQFQIGGNVAVGANFQAPQFTLNITSVNVGPGPGAGSVSVTPPGDPCSTGPGQCLSFASGMLITAKGTPQSNTYQDGWTCTGFAQCALSCGGGFSSPCVLPVAAATSISPLWNAPAPTVSSVSATPLSSTSEKLTGTVHLTLITTTTSVYFQWGTTPSLGIQTTPITTTTDLNNFSMAISVTPNTTYYYRLVAQNVNGTSLMAPLQFTSSP
jgi:uncharacterized protein YjdB